MIAAAVLFAATLVGGLVASTVRWNDRHLHIALALSTGVFLGAVFLHLLPSLAGGHQDHAGGAHWEATVFESDPGHDNVHAPAEEVGAFAQFMAGDGVWFFVLVGVLLVYLIEALVLRSHDHDEVHQHRAVGLAVLVGLSVHSFTGGLGLGIIAGRGLLVGVLLVAMAAHKFFDAFSLSTVLRLAKMPRRTLLVYIVAFSFITPLGMVLGDRATAQLGELGMSVVTSLAAGTFLYVSVGELLPEVFHHREDALAKLTLLAGGIAVTMLLHGAGA